MKECLNYNSADDASVECRACAHYCHIQSGRTGICGVRQNIDGRLFSLVYGRAAAVNIDPIEKKPLFHFFPGSLAYSFGTAGCNFRCANCQNYDISQIFGHKGDVAKYDRIGWGEPLTPTEIVSEAAASGCLSIAYTYTEPTVFLEYALDTMRLAKEKGLKNVWVSNGFMSKETAQAIFPYLDAINIDIKSFDDGFYRTNCGARLEPVLESCRRVFEAGIWLELTTLVIPTLSDSERMFQDIAGFIKNELSDTVPWHVSAFSGEISWKLKHLPRTSPEVIKRAYDIGKEAGLKYVYAGNVWDMDLENTFCPNCGKVAISRIGFSSERNDENGHCRGCGAEIKGVLQ